MKQLVIFKTHILSWWILEEFEKLKQTKGIDCVVLFDNSKNTFKDDGELISRHSFEGCEFDCILLNEQKLRELNLPFYTEFKNLTKFERVIWYNADYATYFVKSILPNYDYYWHIEYDIYCKCNDYSTFFEKYEDNFSDLILPKLMMAPERWPHSCCSDWIYPPSLTRYSSFFPVGRMSSKLIDFLMKRRIEQKSIYDEAINGDSSARWCFCEYFVAMETIHNGFTFTSIDDENLRYQPEYSLSEVNEDESSTILWHPLKSR